MEVVTPPMTLRDAVLDTDFESAWDYVRRYYGEWDKHGLYKDVNMDATHLDYEDVFNNLKEMQPVKSDCKIVIDYGTHFEDEDEEEAFHTVDGIEDGARCAIEFTPWNEWLGMEICKETQEKYTSAEIVAHCMYEMTFAGFNEEKIAMAAAELERAADESMEKYGSWTLFITE